jgi:class 3 adenylate cyclase
LACDDSHEREVEQRGDDISGLGVNIASRIEAVARPAEVLVYVSPRYQSSLRE